MTDRSSRDPEQPTLAGYASPGERAQRPAPPAQIGRYVVSRTLGHGGMAVVYAAYDPELDRRVAIKVLRGGVYGRRYSVGQARLQREAQTLARLSHPNVVQVYEVGRVDDQIFIAMELVTGVTLRAWQSAAPRRWRDVLRVYMAAGEGLAAAHAVGIVHRDFKPDNVLVGDDGRVRVLDFGLARLDDGEVISDEAPRVDAGPLATHAGAMIGTPAYMAPEQHRGAATDARCDQFGFCVALFEALHGVRPFSGPDMQSLRLAIITGAIADPPPGKTPKWLRRVVLRGLRTDPAGRWPDMRALLTALARDPAQRWRRLGVLALGVLALGLGLGLYARALALQQDRCASAGANLIGVWDPDRREAVRHALLATGTPYAALTWAAVARGLDGYAATWIHQTTDACAATHLRGEASTELLDLRHACLNRRLVALRALAEVLAHADRTTAEKAVAAVEALPALAPCADERYVRARVKPPTEPSLALAVADVREQVAGAHARRSAGDPTGALKDAQAATRAAEALDYPPLHAEAWHSRGLARVELAEYGPAHTDLAEAYHRASQLGADDLAFETGLALARVGAEESRFEAASEWSRHAEDALRRTGDDPVADARLKSVRARIAVGLGQRESAEPMLQDALADLERAPGPEPLELALLERQLGECLYLLGRPQDAREHLDRSLERLRELTGPEHPEYAVALNRLAAVHVSVGRTELARDLYEQVLAIALRAYGERHPRTAQAENNLGYLLLERGELGPAEARFTRALAILEAIHGIGDPHLIIPLTNLARVAEQRDDPDAAVRQYERARSIALRRLGPEHPEMARVADGLGTLYLALGRLADAEPLLVQALAISERTRSEEDIDRAASATNLGKLRAEQGRFNEALELHTAALATYERSLPVGHPYSAYPLAGIGEARLGLGRPRDALDPLERALALLAAERSTPASELAEVRFDLARALWLTRSDRPRARELATLARDALATDPRRRAELASVQTWLAALPRE